MKREVNRILTEDNMFLLVLELREPSLDVIPAIMTVSVTSRCFAIKLLHVKKRR